MSPFKLESLMILANRNPAVDRYYSQVFTQIEKGKKYQWNWCAALFSCYWFIYRKMYLAGVTILLFEIVISDIVLEFLEKVCFNFSPTLLYIFIAIIWLFFAIIFGFCGNVFYYRHLSKKVSAGNHIYPRPKNVDVFSMLIVIFQDWSRKSSEEIFHNFPDINKVGFLIMSLAPLILIILRIFYRLFMDCYISLKEVRKNFSS